MIDGKKVIAIIPAYNEEASIGKVIQKVKEYVTDIVVINDGSADKTADIAKSLGAKVVTHEQCRGYDNAIISGFHYAYDNQYDYMITLDADGQHDPALLTQFITPLVNGNVQVVVGYRNKKARLAEYLFGLYTRKYYGVHDPMCGMKGYDVSLYAHCQSMKKYNSVGSALALEAIKKGAKFKEIKIPVYDRIGKSRFAGRLKGNIKIMKAMINTAYYL